MNPQKVIVIVTLSVLLCCSLSLLAFGQNAELVLQMGHSSSISSVAFSSDGELLASGSADGTIKIWDVAHGQLLRTLSGQGGGVSSVAWSLDGKQLVSGSYDKILKVWDVARGELKHTLSGHEDWIYSVAWSPNGKMLASGSGDGTVRIWDMRRRELLHTLSGHEDWIYSVAWSPNGKKLASGSADQSVRIWEVASGELQHTLREHENWVFSVAWSPNGKVLASGSYDQTVKLWDVDSGAVLHTLSGHEDWVSSITWSPNGEMLASGSDDKAIKVWDAERGELLYQLSGHEARVSSVAWSPDNHTLASGGEDRSIKVWDIASRQVQYTLPGREGRIATVAWSPDGKWLASGNGDQTIQVWNVDRGGLSSVLSGHEDRVSSVVWSPDGTMLASGSEDRTIKIWDIKRGVLYAVLSGHDDRIASVAWSPDGKWLASGSGDKTIRVWDAKHGVFQYTLSGHADWVSSVAWSPDSKMLVSGSGDGVLKVWNLKEKKVLHTLSGHEDWVSSVAWSPDGHTLASGSADLTIRLWNAVDGTLQNSLLGYEDWISSIAWSPDSNTLAFGSYDRTVKLVEVSSGELRHTLRGHEAWVSSVAWSLDGKTLASGSEDGTSRLWDVDSGEVMMTCVILPGHEWIIYHPQKLVYASSPQGDIYVAIRFDHQLRPLYPIDYYREMLKQNVADFKVSKQMLSRLKEQEVPDKVLDGVRLLEGLKFGTQGKYLAAVETNIGRKHMGMYRELLLEYARNGTLSHAFLLPQPEIQPKSYRFWWERTENKGIWVSIIACLLFALLVVRIVLRRVFDPMKTAKKFFTEAGYQKVESLSEKLLLLHPREGILSGLATLYSPASPQQERGIRWFFRHARGIPQIATDIDRHSKKLSFRMKLYLLCKETIPPGHIVQSLRDHVGYETIPLSLPLLQKAVFTKHCEQELWELEEPYLTRVDPYTETKPIIDPNWFYGRDESVKHILEAIKQGQHVGIFGLPKIGKTSFTNQILRLLANIPTVPLNCQAFSTKADVYFEKILSRLHAELKALRVKKLPKLGPVSDDEAFRRQFLALFDSWEKAGHQVPFLIIFDEIEVLFPYNDIDARQDVLTEYVRLFTMLRELAQSRRTLTLLVAASHPDINRHELLTRDIGKNPMFGVFREQYLGNIAYAESAKMIHEIGRWKDMLWDEEAAQRVFYYCGGHPFVTRYFAGEACQSGILKHVTYDRVEQTAEKMCDHVHRHPICNYYRQRVWQSLEKDEQELLLMIGRWEYSERDISEEKKETLIRLEQYGMVRRDNGELSLPAKFFEVWLQQSELK